MELDGYGKVPLTAAEVVSNAVEENVASQAALYGSMLAFSQHPSNRSGAFFNDNSVAAQDTFETTVGVIATCEEFSSRERAEQIASLCIGTEDARVEFLRELAPAGYFEPAETTHDLLSDMFEDMIERGMDAPEIAAHAVENYEQNFKVDLEELLDHVEPTGRAKLLFLAKEAGKQALEGGKIALAVTVGAVLAHKIAKKLD